MLGSRSQNLPSAVAMVEAVYRGAARQLSPVSKDRLAQRAGHFAAGVRFGLDEPAAMRRLHSLTGDLAGLPGLSALLPRVLDGALSLMAADFGTIQLVDPVSGSLWLVTQSGFGPEFLDYFAMVADEHSACGRVAKRCAQTVIADVTTDPGFAPHRGVAAAAGYRAVQSTPLADYAGRLVGVVSTYYRRPQRPPETDLWIMELYGDFAGQAIATHLGAAHDGGPGGPVSQAVISALLGPGDGQREAVLAAAPASPDGQEYHPAWRAAFREDAMTQFANEVVYRLFSVGLSLESARSIVGEGPAADRVAAATREVDRLIHDIRTILFSFAADGGSRPGTGTWRLPRLRIRRGPD